VDVISFDHVSLPDGSPMADASPGDGLVAEDPDGSAEEAA
jgi:hypothetical protein